MGIEFEGIDVLPSINGLSLSNNKARNDGEIVISVPHSALLSVDNSSKIETFKKILEEDEMLNTMENVINYCFKIISMIFRWLWQ